VNFSVSPSVTSSLSLLVIVKSARRNFRKRDIVRQTWGNPNFLEVNTLFPHNISTRVFFICGKSFIEDEKDVDSLLSRESDLQKDMIIANFHDSYHNNTYKSLLAFKWALTEFGGDFKYLALFDDDIYVDMNNVGSFLKELKKKRVIKTAQPYSEFPYYHLTTTRLKKTYAVSDISNGYFIGKVYAGSTPFRGSSKPIRNCL